MTTHGIIILNKPSGMTSHTAVAKVKNLFGAAKAGHSGTLDPAACGVLPIMLNSAVKASRYLVEHDKSYLAKLVLGIETDTEDTTGTVVKKFDGTLPNVDDVKKVLPEFTGDIVQTPPMYSALKVNGQKLYELARKGEEVERQPRRISFYKLRAETNDDDIFLSIFCSKGTYIRTLCSDIGKKLGCGGAMDSLVRTSVGGFMLDAAVTLEQLEAMSQEEREALIIPTESLFSSLKKIELSGFYEKLARNGAEIYLQKLSLENNFSIDEWVRVSGEDGFFAIGRIAEFNGGLAVKSETLFL